MEVKVSVSFASPKKMQKLNKELRGKSYTPAVLSFPYFEKVLFEKQGSRVPARGSYFEATEEGMLLGEVLICKSKAKELAKKGGVSVDEQVSALVVHGIRNILAHDSQGGGGK